MPVSDEISYLLQTCRNRPLAVERLLGIVVSGFRRELGPDLVGIYLHGSLAMGCFNAAGSDVDFLVVVKETLSTAAKRRLGELLLRLHEYAPAKGLEISVVTVRQARDFRYPTPYELHFSKEWVPNYQDHTVDFALEATDGDLAAHFTIVKQRGICLIGQPIAEVFGDVPAEHYLDSIVTDTESSLANIAGGPDSGQCRVPPYAVLNACHVLAYLQAGSITSKVEAASGHLNSYRGSMGR